MEELIVFALVMFHKNYFTKHLGMEFLSAVLNRYDKMIQKFSLYQTTLPKKGIDNSVNYVKNVSSSVSEEWSKDPKPKTASLPRRRNKNFS